MTTKKAKTLDEMIDEIIQKTESLEKYVNDKLTNLANKYTKKELILDLMIEIRPKTSQVKTSLRMIKDIQKKLQPAIMEAERIERLQEEYKL